MQKRMNFSGVRFCQWAEKKSNQAGGKEGAIERRDGVLFYPVITVIAQEHRLSKPLPLVLSLTTNDP